MKSKDFHLALTETIDLVEWFPKTFRTMLVTPSRGFAEALNPEATARILPGVFLLLNLMIADLLPGLLFLNEIRQWSLQVIKDLPSHIIGTLIFLFIVKFSFRKAKTTELLTIICLSSIVYIPLAVVMLAIEFTAGPSIFKFLSVALSHHYQTSAELFAPLTSIWYKLVPLFFILTVVFLWWLCLLSSGCGHIVPVSKKKRFLKLGQSMTIYVVIFIATMAVVVGSTLFSMMSGLANYEKMRTSFEKGDYAQAFFLASGVANNEKLPPVGRYRAYLIGAVSQVKTFWKADDLFEDAIIAINANKYRDAEIIMRKKVESRLLSMDSPMRLTLKNVETALAEAAKQYNSPLYTEAPTDMNFLVLSREIPINLFPSF